MLVDNGFKFVGTHQPSSVGYLLLVVRLVVFEDLGFFVLLAEVLDFLESLGVSTTTSSGAVSSLSSTTTSGALATTLVGVGAGVSAAASRAAFLLSLKIRCPFLPMIYSPICVRYLVNSLPANKSENLKNLQAKKLRELAISKKTPAFGRGILNISQPCSRREQPIPSS